MTLHCDGTCCACGYERTTARRRGVLLHKGKAGIEKRVGKGTYYSNDAVGSAFEVKAHR